MHRAERDLDDHLHILRRAPERIAKALERNSPPRG